MGSTETNEQAPLDELLVTDAELWQDGPPYETFKRLRSECPVHWTSRIDEYPEEEGYWSVTKAEDVVEYMLAGASAVGIGYAGFRNPTALVQIIDDLAAWCDERGIKKVTELIGAVRDQDMETDTLMAASVGV